MQGDENENLSIFRDSICDIRDLRKKYQKCLTSGN